MRQFARSSLVDSCLERKLVRRIKKRQFSQADCFFRLDSKMLLSSMDLWLRLTEIGGWA